MLLPALIALIPSSAVHGAPPSASPPRPVAPAPAARVIPPREASWAELGRTVYDPAWTLPDAAPPGEPDLVARMERLLARRFEAAPGAASPYRGFGDLVAAVRDARRDVAAREALFAEFRRLHPSATREIGVELGELLREDHVLRPGWDPDADTESDGFLHGDAQDAAAVRALPWRELRGDTELEQVATLVLADLDAFLTVVHDFRGYPDHVGASLERAEPREGTHLRGADEERGPFAAVVALLEADLPFPFGGYELDLHVRNRVDARGRVVTDIHGESSRFYWFAGRDVFLPVTDSEGRFVALLVVRQFGFDLRGIPDDAGHRRAALRSGLGNFKLRAERLQAERGAPAATPPRALPEFPVQG